MKCSKENINCCTSKNDEATLAYISSLDCPAEFHVIGKCCSKQIKPTGPGRDVDHVWYNYAGGQESLFSWFNTGWGAMTIFEILRDAPIYVALSGEPNIVIELWLDGEVGMAIITERENDNQG